MKLCQFRCYGLYMLGAEAENAPGAPRVRSSRSGYLQTHQSRRTISRRLLGYVERTERDERVNKRTEVEIDHKYTLYRYVHCTYTTGMILNFK